VDRGILQIDEGLDSEGNPTHFASLPVEEQDRLRRTYEDAIDGPPMGLVDPKKREMHFDDWLRKYGYRLR